MEVVFGDLLLELESLKVHQNSIVDYLVPGSNDGKTRRRVLKNKKKFINIIKIYNKIKNHEYKDGKEIYDDMIMMFQNMLNHKYSRSTKYCTTRLAMKCLKKNKENIVSSYNHNIKRHSLNNSKNSTNELPTLVTNTRKRKILSNNKIESKNDLLKFFYLVYYYRDSNTDDLKDQVHIGLQFNRLPCKYEYPQFYRIIETPFCFKTILYRIENMITVTLSELKSDLKKMFNDFMRFFEPTSQIYKYALLLSNYLDELELSVDGSKEMLNHLYIFHLKDRVFLRSIRLKNRNLIKFSSYFIKYNTKESTNNPSMVDLSSSLVKTNSNIESFAFSNNPNVIEDNLSHNTSILECDLQYKLFSVYKKILSIDNKELYDTGVMCCPSYATHPDYYSIIEHPIDMMTIRRRLKQYQYTTIEQFLGDFKLLTTNIRKISNSNHSLCANHIENILFQEFQLKTLDNISNGYDKFFNFICNDLQRKKQPCSFTSENQMLASFYDFLTKVTDSKGKNLYCSLNLVTELSKIKQKSVSLYDAFLEINTVLEKICRNTTIDSVIYEDALLMHYELVQYTQFYFESKIEKISPVSKLVTIISNIWDNVIRHQDSSCHIFYYSLSHYTFKKPITKCNKTVDREITFDLIDYCVKNNIYENFKTFQNDFIGLCSSVRSCTNIFSEPHKDAVELMLYFVKIRDELISDLDTNATYLSKALLSTQLETELFNYPIKQRENIIEKYFLIDRTKLNLCSNFTDYTNIQFTEDVLDDCIQNGHYYRKGDAVKIMESDSEWLVLGFLEDTLGIMYSVVAEIKSLEDIPRKYTRTYFPSERIVTDHLKVIEFSAVKIKLHLMYSLKYLNEKPNIKNLALYDYFYSFKMDEYFFIDQLYVTEGTITSADCTHLHEKAENNASFHFSRSVTLYKTSDGSPKNRKNVNNTKLKKLFSVFNTKSDNDVTIDIIEDDGLKHYLQVAYRDTFYRINQYVYIHSNADDFLIGEILDIWEDINKNIMVKCVLFLLPEDIDHSPLMLFEPNEIFKTYTEVIFNIEAILSHCIIIPRKFAASKKPLLYHPSDIYLCQAVYDEKNKVTRKYLHKQKTSVIHPQAINDEYVFYDTIGYVTYKLPSPYLCREAMKINEKRNRLKSSADKPSENSTLKDISNESQVELIANKRNLLKRTRKPRHLNRSGSSLVSGKAERLSSEGIIKKKDINNELFICQWKDCYCEFYNIEKMFMHLIMLDSHGIFSNLSHDKPIRQRCCWKTCYSRRLSLCSNFYELGKTIILHICKYHCYSEVPSDEFIESCCKNLEDFSKHTTLSKSPINYKEIKVRIEKNNTPIPSVPLDINNTEISLENPATMTISGDNTSDLIVSPIETIIKNTDSTANENDNSSTTSIKTGNNKDACVPDKVVYEVQSHSCIEFKDLLVPFITNVGLSIKQLNTQISSLNNQIMNLHFIITEQSRELTQLKHSQHYSHHSCDNSGTNNLSHNLQNQKSSAANTGHSSNWVCGSHYDTNLNYHNGDFPLLTPFNTTLLESASTDLLRLALQHSCPKKSSLNSEIPGDVRSHNVTPKSDNFNN